MSQVVYSTFESANLHKLYRPRVATWGVAMVILTFLLCVAGGQLANFYQQQTAAADTILPTKVRTVTPKVAPLTSTPPSPQQNPIISTHVIAPVQPCSPYKSSTLPTSIGLSTAPDGLSKLVDTQKHYEIYGNDPSTLRNQIRSCAPKSGDGAVEFAAETSYQLTWQYSFINVGNDMCKVTHAKVGVHVSQVLPLWQPTIDVQSGLAPKWQAFMASLQTHENGHVDIDTQYAQMLLDDLNAFPATPCAQLAQSIKHLTDSDVATLNQANDNYDSSTNHGATQGAILP